MPTARDFFCQFIQFVKAILVRDLNNHVFIDSDICSIMPACNLWTIPCSYYVIFVPFMLLALWYMFDVQHFIVTRYSRLYWLASIFFHGNQNLKKCSHTTAWKTSVLKFCECWQNELHPTFCNRVSHCVSLVIHSHLIVTAFSSNNKQMF